MIDRKKVLWGVTADDDRLVMSRLCDIADRSESAHKAMFSRFLNPGQKLMAQRGFDGQGKIEFFGGMDGAERTVAGFNVSETDFCYPIKAIKIISKNKIVYSHRDYLGSILSLGIKRELLGDIVTNEGYAVLFCLKEISEFIADNLQRVASATVRCEILDRVDSLSIAHNFKESSVTVSSMRADCVISAVTGFSRSKSAEIIDNALVQKNYQLIKSVREQISDGDILSIRGYGKAIIESNNIITKKGRIHLTVKKYV